MGRKVLNPFAKAEKHRRIAIKNMPGDRSEKNRITVELENDVLMELEKIRTDLGVRSKGIVVEGILRELLITETEGLGTKKQHAQREKCPSIIRACLTALNRWRKWT